MGKRKFLFQVFKCPMLFLLSFKRQHFLKRFENGFAICEKAFMIFQWKLTKSRKDHIPLTMTNLFHSRMACNFLGLSFSNTSSLNKMCPRKSIFSCANPFFAMLANNLTSWSLSKTYYKCYACYSIVLEYAKILSM